MCKNDVGCVGFIKGFNKLGAGPNFPGIFQTLFIQQCLVHQTCSELNSLRRFLFRCLIFFQIRYSK